MRTFSLISILFLSNFCFGQNWELFKANETYNFNFDQIHGVRVDSVSVNGNETLFHFNRILNDTVPSSFGQLLHPTQDITQPNIFGKHAVERNDSLIFTNQFGNLLYIKPLASLNDSWNFLQLSSARIEATVDSVYSDSINQVLDSVKRISFQYFDSLNNPINHSINTKKLLLSKANGVVSTLNLYEDVIGQSINYNYKKQYNQIFRSTVFTNREVFDLNIGDEYHFQIQYSPISSGPAPTDIRNHIVTGKTLSANGDTIKLNMLEYRKYESGTVDWSVNPPTVTYTTSYTNRTFEKLIVNPSDTFIETLGMEVIISNTIFSSTLSAHVSSYSNTLPYNNGNFGQRITISPKSQFFLYDSTLSSWTAPIFGIGPYSDHFLTGVFDFQNFDSNSGGSQSSYYHRMIYFKKGNETWGTPQLVTGIRDKEMPEQIVKLYPNPAKNNLTIQVDQNESFDTYEILDVKGRFVQNGNFKAQLVIEELDNGIYFLKLSGNENMEVLKFIKE